MRRVALLVSIVGLLLVIPAQFSSAGAEGADGVFVTNFPETQHVTGTVVVGAPVPHTRLETVRSLVSPALPSEFEDYTDAGTIDASGFAAVSLSLAGAVQGRLVTAGPIGALLLPDVPEIVATFRNHGIAQFALRLEAQAAPSPSGLFHSEQAHVPLGFPRYRILLYNGTARTSEVVLYAYLKSS